MNNESTKFEYIWGKNPVIEAVNSTKREISKVFILQNRFSEYKKLLKGHRLDIEKVSKERLFKLLKRKDHQGIAALTSEYVYAEKEMLHNLDTGYVLAIDNVTDPQNMGSIIRSAFQLGCKAILIPEKNSSKITPVVMHTSAGATEKIDIIIVDSLKHTINELKKRDYKIFGSQPPSDKTFDIREIEPKEKNLIVMGSEGYGIRQSVINLCDETITIPQAGSLDSFSVSAATAIICFVFSTKLKAI